MLVPRGGIEFLYMLLYRCYFLIGGFLVYPSMYPASNSHAACCCGDEIPFPMSGAPGSGRAGWLAVRISSWRRRAASGNTGKGERNQLNLLRASLA
jgi:hypothetical protein